MNIDFLINKYRKIIKEQGDDLEILSDSAFCVAEPIYRNDKEIYKKFIRDLKRLKLESEEK